MRKFTDDDKAESNFGGDYFGFGVHKVQIGEVENGGTGDGEKEYIEISVMDSENGEKTDTARVWFTTDKAANFAFNTLRSIYVHNAPEAKKEAARKTFDALLNTDEICAEMNDKLVGKECWFTKYPDPTRTYTGKDGSLKKSINKNVYGYTPKLREDLMPKDSQKSDDITIEDLGGEADPEAAKNIPTKW